MMVNLALYAFISHPQQTVTLYKRLNNYGTRLAYKVVGHGGTMHFINPLLLDRNTPNAAGQVIRSAIVAPETTDAVRTVSFNQTLASVQLASVQPASIAPENTMGISLPLSTASTPPVAMSVPVSAPTAPTPAVVNAASEHANDEPQEMGFSDFLDVLNPLQHIPVVSSVYRALTGDTISDVARVAGDVMYGAAVGTPILSGIIAVASVSMKDDNGDDLGVQVVKSFIGDDPSSSDSAQPTMLAQNDTSASIPSSVPAATPVVAATTSPSIPDQAPEPTTTAPMTLANGKQPFGGVMDTGLVNHSPVTSSAVASTVPMAPTDTRLGNIIYTNPKLNSAARMAALQAMKPAVLTPATAPTDVSALPITLPTAAPLSAAAVGLPIPADTSKDSKKLGDVMHSSARLSAQGNTLPPDLVNDMMMMALDKYKTAAGMGASQMNVGMPN